MKVALIAGVRANLPALNAVMAHARSRGVEAIWNVGDSLVYGPFPEEVVDSLRTAYVLSTLGDDDRRVLRFPKRQAKWRKSKPLEEYVALQWTHEQLSKRSRKYLRFLSREVRLRAKDWRFLLTHDGPDFSGVALSLEVPDDTLHRVVEEHEADLIAYGHEHQPSARRVNGVWFVNPGSVGWPDDGDPRASYALLELGADEIGIQHFRVEYDVAAVAQAIHDRGLPPVFAQMFEMARDLDSVLSTC